jgi:hypothetical protein
MNNIENNKLIAEFMGFELQTNPNEKWFNQWFTKETLNKPYHNRIEILHFDTDWNWLMEVIETILNICAENDDLEKYAVITDNIPYIQPTYNACIEFIKKYNNNNG